MDQSRRDSSALRIAIGTIGTPMSWATNLCAKLRGLSGSKSWRSRFMAARSSRLTEGMTGALFVRGEGIDYLAPGWVLGQPVQSEQASGTPPIVPEPVHASQVSR